MDKIVTIVVLGIASIGMVAWDIYIACHGAEGATISRILLDWSRKVWFIPWAWGVFAGHLFVEGFGVKGAPSLWSIAVLLSWGLIFGITGVTVSRFWKTRWPWSSVIGLILGTVCGATLWPQT